ncbi:hypothetical protein [Streptacidiphilus cavernicola]|uniref:SMI1/KNR4 family protein n=1 Tax=Streptacidiphilus cavernicola TaxID=3342716 RepID=A0ABV6VPK6_9ACTN
MPPEPGGGPDAERMRGLAALRHVDARQLVDELTGPVPRPGLRLADAALLPDPEHPLTAGLLRELGGCARTWAEGRLPAGVLRRSWPGPGGTRVLRVSASWWSVVGRHPGGPVLALVDGDPCLYDLAGAVGVDGLLSLLAEEQAPRRTPGDPG